MSEPQVFPHETVAEHALAEIRQGAVVGLGTGRAATEFVNALADRVRDGLVIRGIPTSAATAARARTLGIPLTTLEDVEAIDVTVDGADEVSPERMRAAARNALRERKSAEAYQEWISQIRDRAYVEVRLEDR